MWNSSIKKLYSYYLILFKVSVLSLMRYKVYIVCQINLNEKLKKRNRITSKFMKNIFLNAYEAIVLLTYINYLNNTLYKAFQIGLSLLQILKCTHNLQSQCIHGIWHFEICHESTSPGSASLKWYFSFKEWNRKEKHK